MSQNVSPNSTLDTSKDSSSPPVTPASEASRFSADDFADRLMNDLFQDVEHLLNGSLSRSVKATPPPVATEAMPQPAPVIVEETHLALPIAQPEQPLMPPVPAMDDRTLAPLEQAIPSRAAASIPQKRPYDRLLLAVGCLSVVVSLGLWLYQDRQQPVAVAPGAIAPTDSPNRFAEYAQKALRAINGRSPQPTATQLPQAATGSGMPTVTIPPTNTPASERTGTGSQRIYVPVYQIPSNLRPPGTPVAPLPSAPVAVEPAPVAPARSKPPVVASTSGVSRKLVGVLDQGDRSVALFEVGGVTQRYEIGESIGSSGWTLVEVTKQQAIIRRNGEVRSLFVGHVF